MNFNHKAIKELSDKIESENNLFNSLSKNEKKVIVAQDCLARIYAKQIVPYCQMFVHEPKNMRDIEQPLQRQLNTPEMETQCEVCAKGGLFMSYVGRVNDFDKDDLSTSFSVNEITSLEHKKLLEIFTEIELSYIEFAFEGDQFLEKTLDGAPIIFDKESKRKAQQFYADNGGEYYGNVGFDSFTTESNEGADEESEKRMIAICENIIKNRGEFIL